ncbi:hypothetical protein OZ999_12245 [Staphylococcus pseudintermedius]|nr:hypothetical protein [Staphylococcus pseudintermedius]MDE9819029.1 hypothetical protein [Staphylococcus pseudintermedius]MDE9822621.1 hypothetical protein [Staphylococcus pseudintermedius]MDE9828575.1 hypothetical protein [Staphylococcus pseudintermedius]MDE9849461.1 hypothetical protein [Staphylococcus pseudintermedius]MDE9851733.1 hypothetical protein [Staphylococcus pseudintermedius]
MDFTTTLDAHMSPKDAYKAFLEIAEREQKKQQGEKQNKDKK